MITAIAIYLKVILSPLKRLKPNLCLARYFGRDIVKRSLGKHEKILIGGIACRESESGDRRQSERDQNIVAGERNAKKTPGRFIAADDADRLQLIEQRAFAGEIGHRPRTIGGSGPKAPLDAGVVSAERGAHQHGLLTRAVT